jgi:nucleoid-associated protein YgaU
MGIFDKKDKPKPNFSNVQGDSTSTAPPARTGASAPAGSTYVVKPGDSLSKIAKEKYGDANQWRRIFEANRDQINDPDLIHPGQSLRIPSA